MKLRVARARPSEVLDGPALVAFVVAELATRAEVLVRLATVEVETAEFPADAKMLRGAPALADVVRFEVNSGLKCVPMCLSSGVLNWSVGPGASTRQSIIESARVPASRVTGATRLSQAPGVSPGALAQA